MRSRNPAERDRILDDAIRAGKFREDRRPMYAAMYDADPKGTTAIIAQMPGLPAELRDDPQAYDTTFLSAAERDRITAAPSGDTPAAKPPAVKRSGTPAAAAATDDDYPQGWLSPSERETIAAAQRGEPPAVVAGDGIGGRPPRRGEV